MTLLSLCRLNMDSPFAGDKGALNNTCGHYLEQCQDKIVHGLYGKGKAMLGWDPGYHAVWTIMCTTLWIQQLYLHWLRKSVVFHLSSFLRLLFPVSVQRIHFHSFLSSWHLNMSDISHGTWLYSTVLFGLRCAWKRLFHSEILTIKIKRRTDFEKKLTLSQT